MEDSYGIKLRGGVRVGNFKATWPFATLKVSKERLELQASMMGTYVFSAADIVRLEPVFGGIRIHHRIDEYDQEVVFLTTSNPAQLAERMWQIGFLGNTAPLSAFEIENIKASRQHTGFPVRKQAAIVIFLIWIGLFLSTLIPAFSSGSGNIFFGIRAPFIFMITLIISLLVLEPVRNMVFKPGRTIAEIKPVLFFILFICVMILLASFLVAGVVS